MDAARADGVDAEIDRLISKRESQDRSHERDDIAKALIATQHAPSHSFARERM